MIARANMPQFIVIPRTGMQICRRLPLSQFSDVDGQEIWKAAPKPGQKPPVANPLLPLIRQHIACHEPHAETSDWMACDPHEAVFFRLVRVGSAYFLDMVIDTHNGPGLMPANKIECILKTGLIKWKQHRLASFFVETPDQANGVLGNLVMDFGNTATAIVFAPVGVQPLEARAIPLHNTFDPLHGDEQVRSKADRALLKSTTLVLRVPDSDTADPWLVLGRRAEELIANADPLLTSLSAPKKYVRHWPAHLSAQEPTTTCRGWVGQRSGLFPCLLFVDLAVHNMLQLVLSSLTNPDFTSAVPSLYPWVRQVLLTYPLTWRKADQDLFLEMVRNAAAKLFVLDERVRQEFKVEFVCSEPVAVAAYVLWDAFFHFMGYDQHGANLKAPSLVSSLLGNMTGAQEVRLLIVDIGGGSTDIALIEASWAVTEHDGLTVDVRFREVESLRFHRAGDRIAHIMATAILEYFKAKYDLREPLAFQKHSAHPGFTLQHKRQAVSSIADLVEQAKAQLARNGKPWVLEAPAEQLLMSQCFEPARDPGAKPPTGCQLEISLPVLQRWLELDRQSMQSRGEPGFMDIFLQLEQMGLHLWQTNRAPHIVVLSGRTTRLPFIKQLTATHLQMPLHRVRLLQEFLPASLHGPDHQNIDKLAVVLGAHRFRFGGQIRFHPVAREPIFSRYLGTLSSTARGLRLNKVLVEPGATQPRDSSIALQPFGSVLIGHAFRPDGPAEVIADLTNQTGETRTAELELRDDYTVVLKNTAANAGLVLTDGVPGGTQSIVDNFCDTGAIDTDPEGFLARLVLSNRNEWIKNVPS